MKRRKNTAGPVPAECPLDEVLSLLGSIWTPRILWFLRGNPRRFSELRSDLGRISAKVLTDRLATLTDRGLIARENAEYTLTPTGQKLSPLLDAMEAISRELRTSQR